MSLEDEARRGVAEEQAIANRLANEAGELIALFNSHDISPVELKTGEAAWVIVRHTYVPKRDGIVLRARPNW